MDDLRPDALATVAARVVAWHNRHPLARRITAAQVQSVGYVALPYLAPAEGADAPGDTRSAGAPSPTTEPAPAGAAEAGADQGKSLRERALARAQAQPASGPAAPPPPARAAAQAGAGKAAKAVALKPAFAENFMGPLALRRVVRWAAKHGAAAARAPHDGPVREVAVDRSLAGPRTELVMLYALTALVEVRGKRVRMLLGGGASAAVIGKRLWSLPRLTAGATLLASVAAAAGLGYVLMVPTQPAAAAAAASAPLSAHTAAASTHAPIASIRPPALRASAAAELAAQPAMPMALGPHTVASGSAAHAPEAAARSSPPVDAAAVAPAVAAAPALAPALAAPPPPTRPMDVEPTLGRIVMPPLRLPRGDGTLAGARERRLAPATSTEPAPASAGHTVAPPQHAPAEPPAVAQTSHATAATPALPAADAPPALPPLQARSAAPQLASATRAATATPAQLAPAAAPLGKSAFAVSSRLLRTRAEAEQTLSAMRALLVAAGHTTVHVELVPAGEDWHVVGWPFAQRTQADSARTLLAARGMRVTVIDF